MSDHVTISVPERKYFEILNCYTTVRGWQWQVVAFELFTVDSGDCDESCASGYSGDSVESGEFGDFEEPDGLGKSGNSGEFGKT